MPISFNDVTLVHIQEATSLYRPEEHANGRKVVLTIDRQDYPVKAIGALAYELVHGFAPHSRDFTTNQFQSHIRKIDPEGNIVAIKRLDLANNAKSISFFTSDELNQYHKVIAANRQYRVNDPSTHQGAGLTNTLFAKTNYWGELLQEELEDYVLIKDNTWQMSGNLKPYAWACFYLNKNGDQGIYFTLGAESYNSGGLLLKLDCQRTGKYALSPKKVEEFDKYIKEYDVEQLYIPAARVDNYNWPSLTEESLKFIYDNRKHFDKLAFLIFEKINLSNDIPEKVSLNTILYGPPGTGKTYHMINYAVACIEGSNISDIQKEPRKVIKDRYDQYVREGFIAFTTFHQNLSYEDFVEGIKPVTIDKEVVYEVEDGIFRKLCNKASITKGNFDDVLEMFKNDVSESDGKEPILIKASTTEFLVTYRGTNVFYVQPSFTTKDKPWYPVNINNIRKAFETESFAGVYNPTYVREILNFFKQRYGLSKGATTNTKAQRYILIIDEINRGNVALIFGELITLIEDGKRKGQREELEVILPYSKSPFSVPENLHIIGTMNTADRSVEALDTALRRRFVFQEMPPDPDQLESSKILWRFLWHNKKYQWNDQAFIDAENAFKALFNPSSKYEENKRIAWSDWTRGPQSMEAEMEKFSGITFSGILLDQMLYNINRRLETLLNKDQTIGHAWLMNVYSLADLQDAFSEKIIPLLKELFYNDYGKIGLVLGGAFVEFASQISGKISFAKKFTYDGAEEYLERPIYRITDRIKWTEAAFKAIYEP